MNPLPKPYWWQETDEQSEFALVIAAEQGLDDAMLAITKIIGEHKLSVISSLFDNNPTLTELRITTTSIKAWGVFTALLQALDNTNVDIAVVPVASRRNKLLVCDMDSTVVTSETLDDIAAVTGQQEVIKDITARAMNGEIDFEVAFRQRIKMLVSITEAMMNDVTADIQLSPGASELLAKAKSSGMRTVLVSGGIEPVVKAIAQKLGFDRYVCNRVEIDQGCLTGEIILPIVDGNEKLRVVKEECENLQISLDEACCMGDGANDLLMIKAAGLGIAYQGKPIVKSGSCYQINSVGIDFAAAIMGLV